MAGDRKANRERQPITRHPLFPAVAALWFGALFGLGSLAIRPSLLEEAVVASGIDLLVPAAAPPLGVTARILLALLMASIGSLIGFALGTRIAHVRTEPVQRRRVTLTTEEPPLPRRADRFTPGEAAAPKPLSAFDELGGEDRIAPASTHPAAGSRRRALAMAEPEGPDYARDHAPLPGGQYPAPAISEPDADDVLDLSEALPEAHLVEADLRDEHSFAPVPLARLEAAAPGSASRPFDRVASDESEPDRSGDLEIAAPRPAPEAADDRSLPPRNSGPRFAPPAPVQADVGAVETGPFQSGPAAAAPESVDTAAPLVSPAPAASLWSAAALGPRPASAAEHLRTAPLDSLSQIELIERLALSLQQRRTAATAPVPAPVQVEPAPVQPPASPLPPAGEIPRFGFEPREPVDIDPPGAPFAPVAEVPPRASPLPAAMRPIDFGASMEEDEDAASPISRFPFAANPADAPIHDPPSPDTLAASDELTGDEAEDESLVDESFSSLLDLGRAPPRQPLVRIEEPADESAGIEPVVVFPGHGNRPFAAPAPTSPEPAPAPIPAGARPFDAPSPVPTQPQVSGAGLQRDPEETERALRAALATLQRMSGAA